MLNLYKTPEDHIKKKLISTLLQVGVWAKLAPSQVLSVAGHRSVGHRFLVCMRRGSFSTISLIIVSSF